MPVKWAAIAFLGLLLLTAFGNTQSAQPGTTVGGELLRLDMGRQEVLSRFSSCCVTTPLGSTQVIVQSKKSMSYELGGIVYFEHGKVSGLASDRSWSSGEAPYATALPLYRLVNERTHGTPTMARVYAYSRVASNASSKFVMIQFEDGRRIRLEMTHLDPGADVSQQTVISECVGNCADW